jgi:hypothetical protein
VCSTSPAAEPVVKEFALQHTLWLSTVVLEVLGWITNTCAELMFADGFECATSCKVRQDWNEQTSTITVA